MFVVDMKVQVTEYKSSAACKWCQWCRDGQEELAGLSLYGERAGATFLLAQAMACQHWGQLL